LSVHSSEMHGVSQRLQPIPSFFPAIRREASWQSRKQ
jgi:hypothetical protein